MRIKTTIPAAAAALAVTGALLVPATALTAGEPRTVVTRATSALQPGVLAVSLQRLQSGRLQTRMVLTATARRAVRVTFRATPCVRESGRVRCSRALRRSESATLRPGRNRILRTLVVHGSRRLRCVRADVRSGRRSLVAGSSRGVLICAPRR